MIMISQVQILPEVAHLLVIIAVIIVPVAFLLILLFGYR